MNPREEELLILRAILIADDVAFGRTLESLAICLGYVHILYAVCCSFKASL